MTDRADSPEVRELLEQVRADIAELQQEIGRDLEPDEVEAVALSALERSAEGEPLDSSAALAEFHEESNKSPGQQTLEIHIAHDMDQLERDMGRKLLRREIAAIEANSRRQAARYNQIDVREALTDYYRDSEEDPIDMETRDGRNRYMVERARDLDPEEEPEPDREFDLTDPQQLAEYGVMKLDPYKQARLAQAGYELGVSEGEGDD